MTVREMELQEEVLQLKRILHIEPDRIQVAAVMIGLNLTRCEALILLALYDTGNAWLPTERLERALPDRPDGRDESAVRGHVMRLRRKLGDDVVICRPGIGYTIGGPGILACHRVLAERS